ncbi:16s rrna (guanine(966)-n(2))-methyltransferase ssu rrna m(2)g966 [hydrocarbon metagenome]|uniref:16s rrna (Guanine(966)-n(2))-methyltransferase ssu rrna m(2)g966 n=1 Tax=hydrocarbon metagenome TaxID=938273 RepID=A0A0W8G1S7_9ZZZZ
MLKLTGGVFKGRMLRTAEAKGCRPATGRVRESLFSILGSMGVDWPACRVLDLFAGSGSVGFEAASRGAAEVVFVEKNPRLAALLRDNAAALGMGRDRCRVVVADVLAFLAKRSRTPYQVVFADPPYGLDLLPPALTRALSGGYLTPGGLAVAEIEAGLDVSGLAGLPGLICATDRLFGQTRIMIWQIPTDAWQSTPEPSIP